MLNYSGGGMGVQRKRVNSTVIVISLATALLVGACEQQVIKAELHSSAVFLQHIGESNKSILPIIISDQKISMEVISTVIDELEAYEATKLQVHSDILQKITKLIHQSDTDAAGDILRITIINFDRNSFTYNHDRSVTILTSIGQVAGYAKEYKLVNAIASMKGRLLQKRRL